MKFSNEQVELKELPSIEELIYENLEKNYQKEGVYTACFFCLVILVAYAVTGIFIDILFQSPFIWAFISGWLFLFLISIFYSVSSYNYEGYVLREKDIMFRSGIFFRSVLIIPFNRVQHCEINQGPIDRLFGIAELSLFTAGGSSSDLNIPGLTMDRASRLKQFITGKVSADEEE